MQHDPEKLLGNYNEFHGVRPGTDFQPGVLQVVRGREQHAAEPELIVQKGVELVNAKVDEILGSDNALTRKGLPFPTVHFMAASAEYPNWAGYFSSAENKIAVITGKIKNDPISQMKVFVHEYVHFLSHNSHDVSERVSERSPITQNNNVGFRRFFGLDIRAGKEGQLTSDYFVAFNEATTELLASDILPGVHETYDDYLGLFDQVITDAMTLGLGSEDETGAFQTWSKDEFKNYIYRCFFKGDLAGFTTLLKSIYKKYNISEQQFGLMTHRDDLPTVIEQTSSEPNTPPPSPFRVAMLVQKRLDSKTPADYVTDVICPEPNTDGNPDETKYGAEYDSHVKKHGITYSHEQVVGNNEYEFDNFGYIIYRGEDALQLFAALKMELNDMLAQNLSVEAITERMDSLLFKQSYVSMLSEGFREFYIYKHSKIDNL